MNKKKEEQIFSTKKLQAGFWAAHVSVRSMFQTLMWLCWPTFVPVAFPPALPWAHTVLGAFLTIWERDIIVRASWPLTSDPCVFSKRGQCGSTWAASITDAQLELIYCERSRSVSHTHCTVTRLHKHTVILQRSHCFTVNELLFLFNNRLTKQCSNVEFPKLFVSLTYLLEYLILIFIFNIYLFMSYFNIYLIIGLINLLWYFNYFTFACSRFSDDEKMWFVFI